MHRRAARGDGHEQHTRQWRVGLLCVLGVLVTLAALTGPVAAADTEAPEWGTATKGNATTIDVTVYDNGTLDTGSVTRDDFLLSAGTVENVTVTSINASGANRTGAQVSLHLAQRLNVNNVTVGIRSGASIADEAGNTLTDGTVTVTGMDTRPPRYESFERTRVNSSTVELAITVDERLENLTLSIGGPQIDTLYVSNFSVEEGDTVTYTTRYTFSEEGEYSMILLSVVDRYGNAIDIGHQRKFRYDDSAPTVTVEGPTNATVGEPVTVTANATDDQSIESYRWHIDGGTILPSESVTVAFASPGTHEISVEVTDQFGNTAAETHRILVTGTGIDGTVEVTRRSDRRAVANVTGSGTTQRVTRANGSLVAGSNASLERIRATFTTNETVRLDLSADDRTPPSFATATGGVGLTRFDVEHGNATAEAVTFTFAVSRAALNRTGTDPDAVTLYRDEGGWVPLETAVVSQSGSRIVYQASAPGLSTFVVGSGATAALTDDEPESTGTSGAEPTPTQTQSDAGEPAIVVTNVTVSPEEPTAGDQAVVTVDLANRGTATGDYRVAVVLNGSLLTSRTVTVPAGATRSTEFARSVPEGGTLSVAGQDVATVSGSGGGLSLPAVSLPALGLPNPLSLWPSGLVGTVLSAVVGLVVVVYGVLKALAIYLGY
ncbi:PKD domain-containing protein [Halomicroarcula sp. GCM10025324]|uniref:PKD domain-containing protein n=1 Tax=Haloarcula TaxID=2237 RepID=UPI0023E7922D|nr:PKD domain-containing protein [Halomicroarcula sp. ZS-22-S1]